MDNQSLKLRTYIEAFLKNDIQLLFLSALMGRDDIVVSVDELRDKLTMLLALELKDDTGKIMGEVGYTENDGFLKVFYFIDNQGNEGELINVDLVDLVNAEVDNESILAYGYFEMTANIIEMIWQNL